MNDDLCDRWRTAVHEAAHIVAAAALAVEGYRPAPMMRAILLPGRNATAYVDYGDEYERAVICAAGPLSCPLGRRYRPPRLATPPAQVTAEAPPAGISTAVFASVVADHAKTGITDRDAEVVRAYCAASTAGPAVWAGRWRAVHTKARAIIREHRAAILAIARPLYASGFVGSLDVAAILKEHTPNAA